MPHSITGKGEYSSMITKLENDSDKPRVYRLMAGNELHATQENIKETISRLINHHLIEF